MRFLTVATADNRANHRVPGDRDIDGGPRARALPYLKKIGADDEIRTRDIDLGKVALYQLSYIRVQRGPGACGERDATPALRAVGYDPC